MRIHIITAGAAGMYCGSCIRDNALTRELIRQRHQVLLIPLYTPTRTDEPNVSQPRVFFGGVSVYLEQHLPFFRRTPRWLDRLWDSPLVLKLLSKISIANDPDTLSEMTASMLRGEDGHQNKEFQKLLDWLVTQPRPEVVCLHDAMLVRLAAPIRRALGCAVCCTLQGEDVFLEGLREPCHSQALELIRRHAAEVDGFIAVSRYYADFMAGYLRIPREKIHVVPLGITLDGFTPPQRFLIGPSLQSGLTIGYLARITPEKGLHTLCAAYRRLRQQLDLPRSRLEVAGYLGPEFRTYFLRCERQMKDWGLADEFHYHGVLDREAKIRFLRGLNVFSVPGAYPGDPLAEGRHAPEAKGISLLEAMACGVPVVEPRRGSYTEIVETSGGGLLFEFAEGPALAENLARAIASLWRNPALAKQLSEQGCAGVRRHFSVQREAVRAVEVFSEVLARVAERPSAAAHTA
jgi:glycosyltransferase involved in cell wall biosynthesis